MMPGGEPFDGGSYGRIGNLVKGVSEPRFETREVFIAQREQTVVLEQAAQVRDLSALAGRVEAVVAEWDVTAGEPGQQRLHGGGTFPGEDAFGSVHPAQDFHDRAHRHRIRGAVDDQRAQVLAEGAAGASPMPVYLAFGVAGSALVILGDAGAGQADWPVIGAVGPAGQHAVVSADRADAVGAHRGVEAAVAELLA